MTVDDTLAAERDALRAELGSRAETAIRLAADIHGRPAGYLYAASRVGAGRPVSFGAVYNAEIFTREAAPTHHHIVEALLAVLAVALEDEDERFAGRFDARQHAQLHHIFRHLGDEQRAWARAELRRPPAEQLPLFPS